MCCRTPRPSFAARLPIRLTPPPLLPVDRTCTCLRYGRAARVSGLGAGGRDRTPVAHQTTCDRSVWRVCGRSALSSRLSTVAWALQRRTCNRGRGPLGSEAPLGLEVKRPWIDHAECSERATLMHCNKPILVCVSITIRIPTFSPAINGFIRIALSGPGA
jgi:hypothetical protein